MSGKYQGILSLFHNLKKITEMMLYMIKMATFFDENHLNYLYMSNFISWKMGKLSGKNQGICFTKLSGHPVMSDFTFTSMLS